MEKKIGLFIICLIVVCLSSSVVVALPPMGPPRALLGQDVWEIGVDYGYQSTDLEVVSKLTETNITADPPLSVTRKGKLNISDLKSHIILGRVGYGISDNWDGFVHVGAADADGDLERTYSDGTSPDKYGGFDGGFGFAWGVGTRATFWQDGDVSWGGLVQVTWSEPDDSDISLKGDPTFSGTAELDIWEVQVAIGPTFQLSEGFRAYCGPFLHFVNGDFDISAQYSDLGTDFLLEGSGDVEEESQLGGYAGAHFDVDQNTSCFIEGQLTGDAWAIGVGVARRF
ncbi:MAG: hypothetical protein ACYS3S_11025 [Planctomycetota bacterium]|jgi:hypothetical protein